MIIDLVISSKTAREERALAAEKRLKALEGKPGIRSSVFSDLTSMDQETLCQQRKRRTVV